MAKLERFYLYQRESYQNMRILCYEVYYAQPSIVLFYLFEKNNRLGFGIIVIINELSIYEIIYFLWDWVYAATMRSYLFVLVYIHSFLPYYNIWHEIMGK